MPVVQRRGLTTHLQLLGEGPPLVMLHGLLVGSLAGWYFGAAPRLAKAFRVLCYDLRGHGLSGPSASGYGLRCLGEDLDDLRSEAGSSPVTLVGHSWGALVALRYAIDFPERVAKLVVVEAPLPPSNLPELSGFLSSGPAEQLAALPDVLRDAVAGGSRQGKKLLAQLQRLVLNSSLMKDLSAEPDFSDAELAGLRVPTVCIYGDRSGCLPAGQKLAATIPGAQLHVIPGGHFLPAESAQALTDLLETTLCPK
jgi:pimeloyl-ACP methyl ester carboxylesterase